MKKHLLFVFLPILGQAQIPYFQQEVHYRIDVALDDSLHQIQGRWEMDYVNHSPDTLSYILIHLWANAFQDRSSAFARQKLRQNSLEFHFAPDSRRGGYRDLAFAAAGKPLLWEPWEGHTDIIRLMLPEPLAPKRQIKLNTPFTLQIPASFSRLGHVGQSYQMTQWYPKPAVYDRAGWHPMPYLEWGEYYSEFGSFDVRLTLPENYVVGATGRLESPEEADFLRQKAAATEAYLNDPDRSPHHDPAFTLGTFPPSSAAMKTIRYTADNVHDFAWFADKRFRVQKGQVVQPSGAVTDTWVMFTDEEEELWKDALGYVNRAVAFYSTLVGEYPYPHATAVQSALSAGGGMEYPMITVIGLSGNAQGLDEVITHEVGHNWFYGVLGFNERDHAWMDEGINSYYDHRYSRRYYPGSSLDSYVPAFLQGGSKLEAGEAAYLYLARQNRDQSPATTSDGFDVINYFIQSYEKPAFVLRYLEQYLGREAFDAAMQAFYREWQFRHPAPADFRDFLIRKSGKNLDWLFEGFIYSKQRQDYTIRNARRVGEELEVEMVNRGRIAGPVQLAALSGDTQTLWSTWLEGFTGVQTIRIPAGPYRQLVLDPGHYTLDFQRRNNAMRMNGWLRKTAPLRPGIWPTVENTSFTQFFFQPAISWNAYDGLQFGLWVHNTTIPGPRLSYNFLPFYAFGSRTLTGNASFRYRWLPLSGPWRVIEGHLNGKQYGYKKNEIHDYRLSYRRVAPSVRLVFRDGESRMSQHTLTGGMAWVDQQAPQFDESGIYEGKTKTTTHIQTAVYEGRNNNPLQPSRWRLAWERSALPGLSQATAFHKGSLTFQIAPAYQQDKRLYFRFFAGAFLDNNPSRKGLSLLPNAWSLSGQGFADYRFEESFFGRSQQEGLWSQQIHLQEGGMKFATGPAQRLGRSNNWILALNAHADLPFRFPLPLPVQAYFDLGYNGSQKGQTAIPLEKPLLWSGGLSLTAFSQRIGLFFPVVSSQNIRQTYAQNGASYWNKITFTLDLARLNLQNALEELDVRR